jgi:hypothetical protein
LHLSAAALRALASGHVGLSGEILANAAPAAALMGGGVKADFKCAVDERMA